MREFKKVTVIGANGAVGSGVSGIFASFGGALVYVVARSKEKAEIAKTKASKSVKASSIEERIVPKTYDDLKFCIEESDLIFESVAENLEIKKEIHETIAKYAKEGTIIGTGTSGLSINELKECYPNYLKKTFFGIHFFNPPYSLTLCELIPTKDNNDKSTLELEEYLEKKLFRKVIKVKDVPAFLGNRIGFRFMNMALEYAYKYQDEGGIDYIDSILGPYTGRNMPPLATVDFVGLDIHKAIVDNIYESIKDDNFKLPEYVNDLVKENKIGLKVNEGLYKKSEDSNLVYDIKTNSYREIQKYNFNFKEKAIEEFKKANYKEGFNYIKNDTSSESKICLTFLLDYIVYAIELSKEISEKIEDADIAMVCGFNWLPPLSLIEVLGGKDEVIKLCCKYLEKKNYKKVFEEIISSKYDYRSFIRAKE